LKNQFFSQYFCDIINSPDDQGTSNNQGANNLVIGERLKEVLCSQLMMNDEDADKYCEQITQGKD
jgi:bacterioferritin (cytochrome b1)